MTTEMNDGETPRDYLLRMAAAWRQWASMFAGRVYLVTSASLDSTLEELNASIISMTDELCLYCSQMFPIPMEAFNPKGIAMPMKIQAVTFACGHRNLVQHAGSTAEGRRLARLLAVARCRRCDPNASPVIWFDRPALDAILATEQLREEWSALSKGPGGDVTILPE